jgi:hypothetical protein
MFIRRKADPTNVDVDLVIDVDVDLVIDVNLNLN